MSVVFLGNSARYHVVGAFPRDLGYNCFAPPITHRVPSEIAVGIAMKSRRSALATNTADCVINRRVVISHRPCLCRAIQCRNQGCRRRTDPERDIGCSAGREVAPRDGGERSAAWLSLAKPLDDEVGENHPSYDGANRPCHFIWDTGAVSRREKRIWVLHFAAESCAQAGPLALSRHGLG